MGGLRVPGKGAPPRIACPTHRALQSSFRQIPLASGIGAMSLKGLKTLCFAAFLRKLALRSNAEHPFGMVPAKCGTVQTEQAMLACQSSAKFSQLLKCLGVCR
jgi:hypothetical protein